MQNNNGSTVDFSQIITSDTIIVPGGPRTAVIRTSDRALFKRCRRKWHFQSGLRENLTSVERPSYFWIGTGGHFALEDFHGYNYYGHPVEAFRAYKEACIVAAQKGRIQLPDDIEEQSELAEGILSNYLLWIRTRGAYDTYWVDGVPQVEVKCEIELPIVPPEGYDRVVYQMTFDRIVIIDGELWVLDWKFYASLQQQHLDFDSQMGTYIWGAGVMYDLPVAGAILHQFKKELPKPVRMLKSGEISKDKSQNTTHALYREALIHEFGDMKNVSPDYIGVLNHLASIESPNADKFIRRDRTYRSQHQQAAEGARILLETEDMLNPNLPIYINPTKDCTWDCQMSDICLMMDCGDDWETTLKATTVSRVDENEEWRKHLKG